MELTQEQLNRLIEALNADSAKQRDALIAAIDADDEADYEQAQARHEMSRG